MIDRIKVRHPSRPGTLQPQNSVQVPLSPNNNNQNSSQTSIAGSCPENGKIPLGFADISAALGILKRSKFKTDLVSNVGHCLPPFELGTIKGVSVKPIFLQLGQCNFMRRDCQRILWIDFLADSPKISEPVKYRIDLA